MDKVQLFLIIFAAVAYAASLILAYLNTAAVDGLYLNYSGGVDRKYFQQVSPKGVAFSIVWPIIYLWNLAGIVYVLVSLWLPEVKSPVKLQPTLISKPYLIAYILAFATTVGWLFTFDREILGLALVLLLIALAGVYMALGISCKLVADNETSYGKESRVVLILMRVLIHNGLSLLATWVTVATLIGLADELIYVDSFGKPSAVERGIISVADASSVSLGILMAAIIAWFVLENFIWEKYCRYIFAIYPVLILAFSGLIDKLRFPADQSLGNQNLIIASFTLGLVLVAMVARIIISVWRWKKRSQVSVKTSYPLEEDKRSQQIA